MELRNPRKEEMRQPGPPRPRCASKSMFFLPRVASGGSWGRVLGGSSYRGLRNPKRCASLGPPARNTNKIDVLLTESCATLGKKRCASLGRLSGGSWESLGRLSGVSWEVLGGEAKQENFSETRKPARRPPARL